MTLSTTTTGRGAWPQSRLHPHHLLPRPSTVRRAGTRRGLLRRCERERPRPGRRAATRRLQRRVPLPRRRRREHSRVALLVATKPRCIVICVSHGAAPGSDKPQVDGQKSVIWGSRGRWFESSPPDQIVVGQVRHLPCLTFLVQPSFTSLASHVGNGQSGGLLCQTADPINGRLLLRPIYLRVCAHLTVSSRCLSVSFQSLSVYRVFERK